MAWRDNQKKMPLLLGRLKKNYPTCTEADVFFIMNLGCWPTKGVLREFIDHEHLEMLQAPLVRLYQGEDPDDILDPDNVHKHVSC